MNVWISLSQLFNRFEPELYRTIRCGKGMVVAPPLFTPPSNTDEFIDQTVFSESRIQEIGVHVKTVLIEDRIPEEILSILERCPNVSNFALWINQRTASAVLASLIAILENITIRQFCFDPANFFNEYDSDFIIPMNQPLFLNLTHLEIRVIDSECPWDFECPWSQWQELALLPHLTHLAFTKIMTLDFILGAFRNCAKLNLVVMFYWGVQYLKEAMTYAQLKHSYQIVFLQETVDSLRHWEKGDNGKENFWVRAQNEQERKIAEAAEEAV